MMAIFYEVATLNDPVANPPFAVIRIDTDKRAGSGVEGIVVSLHHTREEAQAAADRAVAKQPVCGFCDQTEDLRQLHNGFGYIEPEYICEGCFTPQDDGPCFDDLPAAPSLPPPSPSMSSEARAENVRRQREIIRKIKEND